MNSLTFAVGENWRLISDSTGTEITLKDRHGRYIVKADKAVIVREDNGVATKEALEHIG